MSVKPKTNKDLAIELGYKLKKKSSKNNLDEWKRRQKLCYLRRKAKKVIGSLPMIIEDIRRFSKHPERDFVRIFGDGVLYSKMITVCGQARSEALKQYLSIDCLQDALFKAGLGYFSKRKLSNPRFKEEKIEELRKAKGDSHIETILLIQECEEGIAKSKDTVALWEYAKKANKDGS
jgi:hypothetical protein